MERCGETVTAGQDGGLGGLVSRHEVWWRRFACGMAVPALASQGLAGSGALRKDRTGGPG